MLTIDYKCAKNLYRLVAVGLSRQKLLDADSKAIQQTEFVENHKNKMIVEMLQIFLEKKQRTGTNLFFL